MQRRTAFPPTRRRIMAAKKLSIPGFWVEERDFPGQKRRQGTGRAAGNRAAGISAERGGALAKKKYPVLVEEPGPSVPIKNMEAEKSAAAVAGKSRKISPSFFRTGENRRKQAADGEMDFFAVGCGEGFVFAAQPSMETRGRFTVMILFFRRPGTGKSVAWLFSVE